MGDDLTPAAGRDYGATLRTPSAAVAERAEVTRFIGWLADRGVVTAGSYHDLWQWSVDEPAAFWAAVWDFFDVIGARRPGPVLAGQMPQARWFEGATINYARNALRHARSNPDHVALRYSAETGRSGQLSYGELGTEVARVAAGLRELGVGVGDRVAAYLPNSPEALIGLLATASLGAVWTSCSPDFGPHSVIDRFAQIEPKVLLAVDGYVYGGKQFDRRSEVAAIAAALPELRSVVMVDYAGNEATLADSALPVLNWPDLGRGATQAELADLEFAEVPFSHPLWVLYSSGTTGLPKPIMHSHGGVVLEHLKALSLHQDLTAADTFFSGPCLGARVEAFDPAGHPVIGEVGELVLTAPMPSMPVAQAADPAALANPEVLAYFAPASKGGDAV